MLTVCQALPLMQSLLAEITDDPGTPLLDIGRILCLFRPRKLECDDTWAEVTSVMSRRPCTVGDISRCLFRYPALFTTAWLNGKLVVRPSSALAVTLLEGTFGRRHLSTADCTGLCEVLRWHSWQEDTRSGRP